MFGTYILSHTEMNPGEGMIRAGQVMPAFGALGELGVDAAPLLAGCGLVRPQIEDPESAVSLAAACRFMTMCVEATGCAHFGLLAARHTSPATLGKVGQLMLAQGDVGSAVCSLIRNLHFTDRGAVPLLDLRDGHAHLGYVISGYHPWGTAAALDLAIGIGLYLMRELCGPRWRPGEIWLAHCSPPDPQAYEDFFGCPVRFNMPYSALLFPEADLQLRVTRNERGTARKTREGCGIPKAGEPELHVDLGPAPPFALQVKRLLRVLLAIRCCSAPEAADLMNVHPRTLNRRLAEAGLTFRRLADDARFDYARTLLHETEMSLTQIATAVGYADPSTFNRRFMKRAGLPPGRWRNDPPSGAI